MKRIMVSGAGGTAAINFVRAIRASEKKIHIVGTDCNKHYLCLAREADKKYLIPRYNATNYIERLNEIIKKENIHFLHAQPDVEIERISEDREAIETKIFLPDKETVRLCHDKFKLIQHLNKEHLPAARNILMKRQKDIERAFGEFGQKIWLRATKGAGGRGSLPVEKIDHARSWIDYWDGWGAFVAEEYLPGRNIAWQGLFKEGELITSLTWERIEYIISHVSPSGITGTPSVAKTIKSNKVNEIAVEVADSVSKKPNGIFSIDFKENNLGVPCVTEINPGRFFTPSLMYVEAGLNLPEIYLRLAFDEAIPKLPKVNGFREGILWIRGIDIEPVASRTQC